jgi:hypothetical protein
LPEIGVSWDGEHNHVLAGRRRSWNGGEGARTEEELLVEEHPRITWERT